MRAVRMRSLRIILLAVLTAVAAAVPVFAERNEPVASGDCGENVRWAFYADGTLRISGEGPMADYQCYEIDDGGFYVENDAPYWNYLDASVLAVVVEDGVTHIGDCAFAAGDNLFEVSIAPSVRSIGRCAFYFCYQLRGVTIPAAVESIGLNAFGECEWLQRAVFEKGSALKEVPYELFMGCTSLEDVGLPEGITAIGDNAFAACSCIRSLLVPDGVVSIGVYAFNSCSFLKSLYLPASVASVGEGFLWNSYRVKDIYFGGTEAQWAKLFPDGVFAGNDGLDADTLQVHYGCSAAEYARICGTEIPEERTTAPEEDTAPAEEPTTGPAEETTGSAGIPDGERMTQSSYAAEYRLGDADMNGRVNSRDARLVLRAAARLETLADLQKVLSDIDKDGKVIANDARAILRVAAKLDPAPEEVVRVPAE